MHIDFETARGSRRFGLAVVCTVLFLTFLDNTIVSVTLADIQSRLGAGVQTLQWIVNGYALAFASLMLAGGSIGDVLGRKKVMLAGVAVFCAGSVIAAIAPGANMLLAGRVVMGVGAAGFRTRHALDDPSPVRRPGDPGLGPSAPGRRCRARRWLWVQSIAGIIVGYSDWRGVFWFNLALGGAAFIAALVVRPREL